MLKIRGTAGAATMFSRHGSTSLAKLGRLVVSAGGPFESAMCFVVRPACSTITAGSCSRLAGFVRTASIPPQTRVQANAPNSPTTSFSPWLRKKSTIDSLLKLMLGFFMASPSWGGLDVVLVLVSVLDWGSNVELDQAAGSAGGG